MHFHPPSFITHIKCYLQLVNARGISYVRKANSFSDGDDSEIKLLAYKVKCV